MTLETPVEELNRVGKQLAKRLRLLGIATVRDLLFHFPFRYEDYRRIRPIASLVDGDEVTIHATVEIVANKRSHRRRMTITEAIVADDSGQMRMVWFNQPFIGHTLVSGDRVFFSGKVKSDMLGVTMTSPAYEKEQVGKDTAHTARIVPMYPLTNGVTQKQLRALVAQAVDQARNVKDWLPADIRRRARIIPLPHALADIHFPPHEDARAEATRRLKFDELFLLQLRAEIVRRSFVGARAPDIVFREAEIRAFVRSLPFTLTNDQKIAAWEILQDIGKATPMNRLLQGDVGSGKTIVAGIAAYNTHLHGYQTLFMAPTEILARQHFDTLTQLFRPFPVSILLVTRSQHLLVRGNDPVQELTKREVMETAGSAETNMIIGTHAILSEDLHCPRLGLTIVDEQHRFGVDQRRMLKEKSIDGVTPHFLSMTATPIPRSLAIAIYGDLDVSIIRAKPPGRKPVTTRFVEPRHRDRAYAFIRQEVHKGRQCFIICPLIEEGNDATFEKKTVLAEYERLSKDIFPDLRLGYLHGKMKPKEKEGAMNAFVSGQTHVLIATSVVEVGVNVPNATVMLIEGAERFGLAQLHQFRGRVGRSSDQAYCFLFASDMNLSERARDRLAFFEKTSDGFALAEYDLQDRGPGDVYGTAQTGMMRLKIATLKDIELLRLARAICRDIDIHAYPGVLEALRAWEQVAHLE